MLHIAAVGIDAGNPPNRSHLRTDDPVLDRAQICRLGEFGRQTLALGGKIGAVGLPAGLAIDDLRTLAVGIAERDRVEEDLAETGAERRQVRLDAVGQAVLRLRETFSHLLAREIDVGVIGEHRRDLAEPVACERAGQRQPGYPGERGLDRKGHLLFHVDRAERVEQRGERGHQHGS